MNLRDSTLIRWLGAIISEAVSGFAHGAIIGGGGAAAADDFGMLVKVTITSGLISAAKDVFLYINANPMPNVFAAPIIAPVAPVPAVIPTTSETKSPTS
jgi:hypothetical protein